MTKQWADEPFALITTPRKSLNGKQNEAQKSATEMANIHNVMIRGLNSIILQAPNVKESQDVEDFMTYAQTWCNVVHEHHNTEETVAFPLLEKEAGQTGLMDSNIDQHNAFTEGIEAFKAYVTKVAQKKAAYDGQKMVQLLNNFGSVLAGHLNDEIATISALDNYSIDWNNYNKILTKHAVKNADKDKEIPFIMTHTDATFEGGLHRDTWPPFPWFAAVLFRLVYLPRHKAAWRFSPCDAWGQPKDLLFA